MNVGDWFAARAIDTGAMKALQVVGVRKESDGHYIQFHAAPPADPDQTEFFGPMTRTLRPVDHDRSHERRRRRAASPSSKAFRRRRAPWSSPAAA